MLDHPTGTRRHRGRLRLDHRPHVRRRDGDSDRAGHDGGDHPGFQVLQARSQGLSGLRSRRNRRGRENMRGPQKYGAVSRGERTGEPARLAAVRRVRACHPGTCITEFRERSPPALRNRRGPITGHVRLTERHPARSEPGTCPGPVVRRRWRYKGRPLGITLLGSGLPQKPSSQAFAGLVVPARVDLRKHGRRTAGRERVARPSSRVARAC